MVETEARALLNAELASATQSSVARDLGVRQSRVSQWSAGHCRPEPHYREALRILLKIPPLAWLTEDEAEIVRRVSQIRKRRAA